jgi:hypothetical protein
LWWYTYGEGLKDPEYEWSAIRDYRWDDTAGVGDEYGRYVCPTTGHAIPSKARSAAIGKAMHSTIERWYEPSRGKADWRDLPGKIAGSGLHLLPHPSKCLEGGVEVPLGEDEAPDRHSESGVCKVLRLDGVAWRGSRDLVASIAQDEWRRLYRDVDGSEVWTRVASWILIDHKSTAKLDEHPLTPAGLLGNGQANLYAFATMRELGLSKLPARWVYYETKRIRRAMPVDTVIELSRATDIVGRMTERAKHLDTITCADDARQNPHACADYGGCKRHVSSGGPCDARRPVGALIQLRVKEERNMPLPKGFQKNFDAAKAAGAAEPETTPEEPTDAAEETPPESGKLPTQGVEKKRGRGRPKKVTDVAPAAEHPETSHDAPADALVKTVTVPGDFAPIEIRGDARDVIEVLVRAGLLSA